MKKLLVGSVALVALAIPAAAADLPMKAPFYKAPIVAPIPYSWSGCYIGGNGGGLWARKDWHVTTTGAEIGTFDADGGLAGGQVGCNYQVSSWVFGLQGDYDWADASGTNADQVAVALTDRARIRSLSSATARIGYAFDRFLGYVKGGAAWERDNYDTITTATGAPFSSASETRSGWTVGVGAEYAFTDWLTGFLEYDFYGFGTRTNAFTTVGGAVQFADIREEKNVVKAGLNFKFNWWTPAAVVARY